MQINNKFAGIFFDSFDVPLRYIYTQTGPLSNVINRIMFWKLYASNFHKLDEKFEESLSLLKKNNVSVSGRVVLELGPGNSYINAYNFLMQGAKKIILVDKFPRILRTSKQKYFYKEELEYIKQKYCKTDLFFIDEDGFPMTKYIKFISSDISKSSLKESVDLIYSVSVLEHLQDVSGTNHKMETLLNPGGFMLHDIDLRDHYNFGNPFLFYKYSDYVWNNYLTKEGLSYTNRWRYDDFMSEFRKYDFLITHEEVERFEIPSNLKINDKFRSYKNLEIGKLKIILQKPLDIPLSFLERTDK